MRNKMSMAFIIYFAAAFTLASNQASAGSRADLFYGPANGKSGVVISGSDAYTCTLDIPIDWAQRCPPIRSSEPAFAPLVTPYVREPACPAQTVTVPMSDGKEQTITIVRCP
jgi:hypothetical protein